MTEIKTINITGTAMDSMTGLPAKKARRNTKKNQNGGADETLRGIPPAMNVVKGTESQSSIAATAASPNSNTWLKYPAAAPVPPQISVAASHTPVTPEKAAAPTGQYAQEGGTKQIKVELKKKITARKVHLNPKKQEAPKTQLAKKHLTRKIRKVTIGLTSLQKRMTRAKKLHKEVKDMPIDKLKDKLIKGGFIKANSKAPENVLRQIAADAEVVKNKAL
jgi:hypothetical protein